MLFALLSFSGARGAAAATVTCTFSGPSLNFGTVNPYSGFPYSTSGTIGVSCTNSGATSANVYACLSLGTGSGGTSPSNRTLASGSDTLHETITNGSTSAEIGDGTTYSMAGIYSGPVGAHATLNASLPIASSLPAPSSPPPPGSYSSSFSGSSAIFYYLVATTAPASCAALASNAGVVQGTLSLSIAATVPTQCKVTSTSMAFPTSSVLTAAVTTSATVNTTCNASVPVTVALDNGATGSGPTARQMKSGSNAITYGIYRDAGMSQPWGQTSGTDTASVSTGTAALTAYGRVPAQTSQAPGSYTDVVNVTISY